MPSLLKSFRCRAAVVRNAMLMQIRVLHQANACEMHSLHASPEEFLLKHGSGLTSHLVSSYIAEQGDPELAYQLFCLARQHNMYMRNGAPYDAIIRSLCKAKELSILEKIMKDMKEESCDERDSTFGFMLRTMSREGMLQETSSLFNRMADFDCKPTVVAYKAVINSLVNTGNMEEAMHVFTAMRDADVYPDSLLVGMLSSGLCKAGKVNEAAKLVESLVGVSGSVDIVTLNGIVGYLCKAQGPSEAHRFIENVKRFKVAPDAVTYNKLMHGFCQANKVDEALRLLEKMSEDLIKPTVVTLNTLLLGLSKQQRTLEALSLIEKMGHIVETDATSFNIMIHALCSYKRYGEAFMLVSEMNRKNLSPTTHTFTTIVHVLFQLGKAEGAWKILKDMKKVGVIADVVFYNELIRGLCVANRVDSALHLLVRMTEDGCHPSKHTRSLIMNGLCKGGRVLEAVEFGQDMIRSGCEMDIICWNPILQGLCGLGKKEEAYKLLDGLSEHGLVPDRSTYNSMIKGLCGARKLDEVRKLLVDMKKNDMEADAVTYITMIDSYAQCVPGTVDLFFPLMEGKVVLRLGKYVSLIDGLLQTGEVEFALKVFEVMQRVGGIAPTTWTFNTIIDGLCKNKKICEAEGCFQKMREYGCLPDIITYTTLMHGLCNVGHYDAVDLMYKDLKAQGGCQPDGVMYSVLLNTFSAGGKFKEMYEVLDDMKAQGCPPNEAALRFLFQNLCHKDTKRVNKYIKAAFGISYTPEDLVPVRLVTDTVAMPTSLSKAQDEGNTQRVPDVECAAATMREKELSSKGSSEVFEERPKQTRRSITSINAGSQTGMLKLYASRSKSHEIKSKMGILKPSASGIKSQEIKLKPGMPKKSHVVRKQDDTKSSRSSARMGFSKVLEGELCQAQKSQKKAVCDVRDKDKSRRKVSKEGKADDQSHDGFLVEQKSLRKRKSIKI